MYGGWNTRCMYNDKPKKKNAEWKTSEKYKWQYFNTCWTLHRYKIFKWEKWYYHDFPRTLIIAKLNSLTLGIGRIMLHSWYNGYSFFLESSLNVLAGNPQIEESGTSACPAPVPLRVRDIGSFQVPSTCLLLPFFFSSCPFSLNTPQGGGLAWEQIRVSALSTTSCPEAFG